MTDRDLATLLHDHVRAGEPPLGVTASEAILSGRRVLRRRRMRRGLASAAAIGAVAAVITALVLPGRDDDPGARIDPATAAALADYDATAMPGVIFRAAGPILNRSATDIVDLRSFNAYDDQGTDLPKHYWKKASSMELTFGDDGPHRVRVSLMHARSEAEGDARKNCADDLDGGYSFGCSVTTVDGDTVTMSMTAVREMQDVSGAGGWGALTREELRTGKLTATNPSQDPIDRGQVYFMRTVESVHSATFLTVAQEIVRAPDLAHAKAAWRLSQADLTRIVTDPTLVIPKPPMGTNGCSWQLHPENFSCGVQ